MQEQCKKKQGVEVPHRIQQNHKYHANIYITQKHGLS